MGTEKQKRIQISGRIDAELRASLEFQLQTLGITKQEFVSRAIMAELGRFDMRKVIKFAEDEADRLQRELDNMQGERDYANDSRDTFKEKYGQAQTAYEKSDAQVKAYQQQGIWGRVFGLKPKNNL